MIRIAALGLIALAFAAPAHAQDGFYDNGGFFGGPGEYAGQPEYRGEPPVILGPVERRGVRMQSPDDIFDMLEDEGFSEFGTMARRGRAYKLTAVNADGDLVALDVSIFDGEILRERILQVRRQASRLQSPQRAQPERRTAPATATRGAPEPQPQPPLAATGKPGSTAAPPLSARLRKPPADTSAGADGDDPLVVY